MPLFAPFARARQVQNFVQLSNFAQGGPVLDLMPSGRNFRSAVLTCHEFVEESSVELRDAVSNYAVPRTRG